MIKLTDEEVKTHEKAIKSFRRRIQNVKFKYADGDITKKVMESSVRDIKEEETAYIKTSGVILYYGQLFKGA